MPSNSRFPLTPAKPTFFLPDIIRTKASLYALRIAQSVGTCFPPLGRWADQQQIMHRARVECLGIQQQYGKAVYDRINREFSHNIGTPLTQRKLQQIANRAELIATLQGIKNSLKSTTDIKESVHIGYAKANSTVDAQAVLLSRNIIDASKHFQRQPELLIKAEAGDATATQLLNTLSESVIREQIHATGRGFTDQQLKAEARLLLDRLQDPAVWAINRFRHLNEIIKHKNSTAAEVLTALREVSSAFELKYFVKAKHFKAPQERLAFLTNQFRDILFINTFNNSNKLSPKKWLDAFMNHPVVIQCWQLSNASDFLAEVQEQIEDKLTLAASLTATMSVSRDRILIESLLTAMTEFAESKVNSHEWMEKNSIPVANAYNNGQSAADFVQADFWQAMQAQVAKETNISLAWLRTATTTEEAERMVKPHPHLTR